jgi:hypothetical protein
MEGELEQGGAMEGEMEQGGVLVGELEQGGVMVDVLEQQECDEQEQVQEQVGDDDGGDGQLVV